MGEKRYYWFKLYDDFFSSKRVKRLRNLAGGATYTIIYLKMQLKALKTNGYLYFDGVMDDFAAELALDLDENPEDVKVALQYLLSVGLIESDEEGKEWFLTYMYKCIGSETASTQRVRDFRERKKAEKALHCNTDVTQVKHLGNVEKEIEIEKDIEIDKEKDIDNKNLRHKYGEYKHVLLSDSEYQKLVSEYGETAVHTGIKKVDEYCEQSGKTYKNYNLTIRKWGLEGFQKLPKVEPPKEDQELTEEEFEALVDSGFYDEPEDS